MHQSPRHRSRTAAPSLAIAITVAAAALARPVHASPPRRVEVANHVLRLNGKGVHEVGFFDVDVYTASLYLERPTSNARAILDSPQVKQLRLHFERDVSRRDLLRVARKGLVKRSRSLQVQRELEWLIGRLSKVRSGDELCITELPDGSVELTHNGRVVARAGGEELCRALFASWLGPEPVSRSLKRHLLGAR